MPAAEVKSRVPPRALWTFQTAVALFVMWAALDGVANLWAGAILAVLGAAAGVWLVPGEPYPWRPWRMLHFSLYFLVESLRAGVDVAWRALSLRMSIEPAFSRIDLILPPGLPRTMFIAVISLMPGTLSVDVLEEGRLEVHSLTPRAARGLHELQRRIARLFNIATEEAT